MLRASRVQIPPSVKESNPPNNKDTYGLLTQLVECASYERKVAGSNPAQTTSTMHRLCALYTSTRVWSKGWHLRCHASCFAGSNPAWCTWKVIRHKEIQFACLAQSVEREALNLVVVGSNPTVSKGNVIFCLKPKRIRSNVAQRKRVWLITRRSVDRNHSLLKL